MKRIPVLLALALGLAATALAQKMPVYVSCKHPWVDKNHSTDPVGAAYCNAAIAAFADDPHYGYTHNPGEASLVVHIMTMPVDGMSVGAFTFTCASSNGELFMVSAMDPIPEANATKFGSMLPSIMDDELLHYPVKGCSRWHLPE